MKAYFALICFLVVVTTRVASAEKDTPTPEAEAPRRLSALVLGSSYVTIEREYGSKQEPIVIKDRAWIEAFAKVLGEASYVPQLHGFWVSPDISFRSEQGRAILSLSVFGSILRVEGDDLSVGEKTAAEIAALIKKKNG